MGGPSAEHDVSLSTGKMVAKNLSRDKFNVRQISIPKSGKFLIPRRADVVFIAMHGPYGEDGTIQGMLETAGIPYTGSGVLASALAMDKVMSSMLLERAGVFVPKFVSFNRNDWRRKNPLIIKKIRFLRYPLVIKPRGLGSSVGVSIVKTGRELGKAIKLALSHSSEVIAQKYIRGTEVACAVIDDGKPRTEIALQPTVIVPKSRTFFDYYSKYTPGASEEITPPRFPKFLIRKIQNTALLCHRTLECSGMSRTDMILAGHGGSNLKLKTKSAKVYVLEVNTIPGMTETSLLPQGAKACGISFPELLERIVNAAINRYNINTIRGVRPTNYI